MRDPELAMRFGRNLKRVRLARGMSQTDLRRLFGGTHGSISSLESGRREPELLTVVRLAGCLDTTIDEFVVAQDADPPRFAPAFEERRLDRPEIAAMIGETIRRLRISRGFDPTRLAAEAGVHPGMVWALERQGGPEFRGDGHRISIPRLSVAYSLAGALGVGPARLVGGFIYVPARELVESWESTVVEFRGADEIGAYVPTTSEPGKAAGTGNRYRSSSVARGRMGGFTVSWPD